MGPGATFDEKNVIRHDCGREMSRVGDGSVGWTALVCAGIR